jgi:hypothetical protein
MKCNSLEDAIVEVARGRNVGPGTAAAVESHVEHCAACAGRLARQRHLTAGLRALAVTTDGDVPSDALERRLLDAFQETQPHAGFARTRRVWLTAAAAALLAIGGFAWWQMSHSRQYSPAVGSIAGQARPEVTRPEMVAPPTHRAAAKRSARPPRRYAAKPAANARAVQAEGFVMLPAAAGLPDFESGEIVRMELPLASLPAYGIAIEPDAAPAPVQADLLIGQDGQARAIRLVTQNRTRSGAEQ